MNLLKISPPPQVFHHRFVPRKVVLAVRQALTVLTVLFAQRWTKRRHYKTHLWPCVVGIEHSLIGSVYFSLSAALSGQVYRALTSHEGHHVSWAQMYLRPQL